MKPIFPRLIVPGLFILLLAACNMPQGGTTGPNSDTVSTKVALTLEALTQSAPLTGLGTPTSITFVPQIPTQTSTEMLGPTNTQIPTNLPTGTTGPTDTPIPGPGTIGGSISGYPYGSVPRLAIVAYGQEPPYNYSYLLTAAGETYFEMSSSYLIPGHYQVIAYDSTGHKGGCTVNVLVITNQTVNCNITSWGGGYRDKPSGVPNP